MARHEFKFVVDGIDLNPEQKEHISKAIQAAAASSLVAATHSRTPENAFIWGGGHTNGIYAYRVDDAAFKQFQAGPAQQNVVALQKEFQ